MKFVLSTAVGMILGANVAIAGAATDQQTIAALDTAYQDAVARNDAAAMAEIQHPDMILVLGDGRVRTGEELLNAARQRNIEYEVQAEEPNTQTVRLYGKDTAIVTALLAIKGTRKDGSRIDLKLWFSDTYVRTPQGWKYVFGQASLPLPANAK